MSETLNSITHNTILAEDCVSGLNNLPAGCVDLVFADPPFNIGYEYDLYQDQLESEQYLTWSRAWMSAVYQALKPEGTFWLAIGDEYAAELKVAAQEIGFVPRSWVIWYYTFGVNCKFKFSRSHAHLFYFVKDAKQFTFLDQDLENRIPSARQLVYNDKRANPQGRLPDDTWIIPPDVSPQLALPELKKLAQSPVETTWTLRPQDVEACFQAEEDTWYFPRVAGTFKERAGFHGCQMPEQLLGRIIRCCSRLGELVVDPFSGSATTLAVAKKLGRNYLGYDLSAEYVSHGLARLGSIRRGDRLEGAAEPLLSAPKTGANKNLKQKKLSSAPLLPNWNDSQAREKKYAEIQLELTLQGLEEAFQKTAGEFSVEHLIADPEVNQKFAETCRELGLVGDPYTWNLLLFRLRKLGRLPNVAAQAVENIGEEIDRYWPASEMAVQSLLKEKRLRSLEEILCNPRLAEEFDRRAASFIPGQTAQEYRLAAFQLQQLAPLARGRGFVLHDVHQQHLEQEFSAPISSAEWNGQALPPAPGLYLLEHHAKVVYAGETHNLQERLMAHQQASNEQKLFPLKNLSVRYTEKDFSEAGPLGWQSCLVMQWKPALNYQELQQG